MRRRRVEITLETHEVISGPAGSNRSPMWCSQCEAHVWMANPVDAAAMARVSVATMYRWIEAGLVHSRKTRAGFNAICMDSLKSKGARKLGSTF